MLIYDEAATPGNIACLVAACILWMTSGVGYGAAVIVGGFLMSIRYRKN